MRKNNLIKDKKRLSGFLDIFQFLFGIQNYDREIIYAKEDKEDYAACIDIEDDYQRITLTIYPRFFRNTLVNQKRYLLHELCHYLTDPLFAISCSLRDGNVETKEHVRRANEKSTSSIANILDMLLSGSCSKYVSYYRKFSNNVDE